MTNTKKCKCEKAHTFLDLYKEENNKVVEKQKWHKCYICSRYKIGKWIRIHEMRCYYAQKNLERINK